MVHHNLVLERLTLREKDFFSFFLRLYLGSIHRLMFNRLTLNDPTLNKNLLFLLECETEGLFTLLNLSDESFKLFSLFSTKKEISEINFKDINKKILSFFSKWHQQIS